MQGLKSRCLTYNASSESSKVRMSFIKNKLNNYLQPRTKSDQPLFSPNNIHDYHQEKGYKN